MARVSRLLLAALVIALGALCATGELQRVVNKQPALARRHHNPKGNTGSGSSGFGSGGDGSGGGNGDGSGNKYWKGPWKGPWKGSAQGYWQGPVSGGSGGGSSPGGASEASGGDTGSDDPLKGDGGTTLDCPNLNPEYAIRLTSNPIPTCLTPGQELEFKWDLVVEKGSIAFASGRLGFDLLFGKGPSDYVVMVEGKVCATDRRVVAKVPDLYPVKQHPKADFYLFAQSDTAAVQYASMTGISIKEKCP